MSYLKYSNLCATMVRDALKEPLKESAKARELVYFKNVTYKDSKPDAQSAWPASAIGRVDSHALLAGCVGAGTHDPAHRRTLHAGCVAARRLSAAVDAACGQHSTGYATAEQPGSGQPWAMLAVIHELSEISKTAEGVRSGGGEPA